MAKGEKLTPVTTVAFYHGEEPYDGCANLHDMLEINKENQTYKRFVADYHMNLVRPEDLDETVFETGLYELVGFLKRQNDRLADERNAGREEGETRFASLASILLASNKLDDLNKAVSDEAFRNYLYKEFAL